MNIQDLKSKTKPNIVIKASATIEVKTSGKNAEDDKEAILHPHPSNPQLDRFFVYYSNKLFKKV